MLNEPETPDTTAIVELSKLLIDIEARLRFIQKTLVASGLTDQVQMDREILEIRGQLLHIPSIAAPATYRDFRAVAGSARALQIQPSRHL